MSSYSAVIYRVIWSYCDCRMSSANACEKVIYIFCMMPTKEVLQNFAKHKYLGQKSYPKLGIIVSRDPCDRSNCTLQVKVRPVSNAMVAILINEHWSRVVKKSGLFRHHKTDFGTENPPC